MHETFRNAVLTLTLKIQGKPHADRIFVLTEKKKLSELKPGYYLRYIQRSEQSFHVYGIEVSATGNVTAHENMSPNAIQHHEDTDFRDDLITLHQEKRIHYHQARTGEGCFHIQEALALEYAERGGINLQQDIRIPEPQSDKTPLPQIEEIKTDITQSLIVKPLPVHKSDQSNIYTMLLIGSASLTAAATVGILIATSLAIASIIALPAGVGLAAGGLIPLGLGVAGMAFFGSRLIQSRPDALLLDCKSNPNILIP